MSFNSFDPYDRSWLWMTAVVLAIHAIFIGWGVFFHSSRDMQPQRASSRLLIQTIEIQPSSLSVIESSKSEAPINLETDDDLELLLAEASRIDEKEEEFLIALNPNPLPPNPIKKNPLPSTPITKNPIPPIPLERKTMSSPLETKKTAPPAPQSKESVPTPPDFPSPSLPPSKPMKPAPEKAKASAKIPDKTTLPKKYAPSKNAFLEKRAAKLSEDKAAAVKKKQEADVGIKKKEAEAATKKKEAEAQLKKKEETEAAKKLEEERLVEKKKEAEQLAERVRQQKLLAAAQERIAKIGGNRDKITAKNAESHSLSPLPDSIKTLQVDALPVAGGGALLSQREVSYRNELASRLKLLLRLPDYGDVKMNLTLDRSGKVIKIVVIEAESVLNKKYIEKTLPGLSFPAFGTNFESVAEYTFSITLSNE